MTAAQRTIWANFRDEYLSSGVNGASLEAIEHAVGYLDVLRRANVQLDVHGVARRH